METRRRKLENADATRPEHKLSTTTRQKPRSRRNLFYLSLLSLLFLLYFLISSNLSTKLSTRAIDQIATTLKLHNQFYVVVFDAGSTGSRALAFSFHEALISGSLVLDEELFVETKPGLSSYSNGREAAESLIPLLDKVKTVVPQAEWKRTPLTLRATAGLRLLPGDRAKEILDECGKLLKDVGYQVTPDTVAIMDGTDEGIYSWFTVNFLLDKFSDLSFKSTVAALDLGGGSTQVTFAPTSSQAENLGQNVYNVNVFNRNLSLYTKSHLGMGLMAARKGILVGDSEATEIRSPCINPIVRQEWTYSNIKYTIMGPQKGTRKTVKSQNFGGGEETRPIVKFADCLKIVESYVKKGIGEKTEGLKEHEIYAFSYYFDRATEVALVDPFSGGVVRLSSFLKQAMEACDYPNTDQPFTCLDLTYIYVLLRDGFGLEPETKLYLYKKINGHELSWALGAAFNIIQSGISP